MAVWCVINNGVVENVIIADTKEIAERVTMKTCVETTQEYNAPWLGWLYDGENFTNPNPPIIPDLPAPPK
jgi:hypothetical protein